MIFIAFGANLPSRIGDPAQTYAALPSILRAQGIEVVRQSSLLQTAPVPVSDQPDYFNGVLQIVTDFGAKQLLLTLMRVENDLGRVRRALNEPRGIDLDLIAYGDEVLNAGELVVPHPRMHLRGFVLYLLREIAPDWVHPVFQKSVSELIKAL